VPKISKKEGVKVKNYVGFRASKKVFLKAFYLQDI